MDGLLQLGLTNVAWATVLALVAAAGTCWLKRYPAVVHALLADGAAEAGDAILGPVSVILGQGAVPGGRAKREQGSDGVSRTEWRCSISGGRASWRVRCEPGSDSASPSQNHDRSHSAVQRRESDCRHREAVALAAGCSIHLARGCSRVVGCCWFEFLSIPPITPVVTPCPA